MSEEAGLAVYKTKLKFVTKEQHEYLSNCAKVALDVKRWYVMTLLKALKEDGVTVLDPFYDKNNKECIKKKYHPRKMSTWFTKEKKENPRYHYVMKYPSAVSFCLFDDLKTNWEKRTGLGWFKAQKSAQENEGKHWTRFKKKKSGWAARNHEITDFYSIEGFPKFPKEGRFMSFTVSGASVTENNEVVIPGSIGCKKLGVKGSPEVVIPFFERSFKIDPSHINNKNSYTTFTFDGKDWWVCIKVPADSTPKKELKQVDKKYVLGIDVGVRNSITCSDGVTLVDPFREDPKLKALYLKEKELSRKMAHNLICHENRESHIYTTPYGKKRLKKSCRYKSLKKKHDLVCVKINRLREYLLNDKILRAINWDSISAIHIEDIKKSAWFKNAKWASKLQKTAVGSIIAGIQDKATKLGIPFEKITQNEDMASTQMCAVCGHKNKHMKDLGQRTFVCENCGHTDDRDHNAAVNLANWVKPIDNKK